jgi:MOSC domain-containing protein YiiM
MIPTEPIAVGNSGRIFQINLSQGGVPKLAQPSGEVTVSGLLGDRQRNLESHGGPDRALCLFSLERILALQEEGHFIFPGAAGENVTISGLDWSLVIPGMRLRLGAEVLAEVTRYTNPCTNIAYAFIDDDYSRLSQKRYPGWSRVYARVIQPGRIKPGDPVGLVIQNL